MYMMSSSGRGDIIFMCDNYYMVKKLDEESRTITIIQLNDELQECYENADFKNKEIERLHKENIKSVTKDDFDKAVNDMLNNKDISTVEEVSAIMKLRSAIYY